MIAGVSSHPIDNYIYGNISISGHKTSYFTDDRIARNWSTISDEDISQRLTEIFNTYWKASRWFAATTQTDPYALASFKETTATITHVSPINKAGLP
jgi:hypothetical protein